jgi:hypothetical protein
MLAGPKQAISGPNEPPPVEPGHRGQLARLIRERPVFVNVAGCRIPDPSKRRNLREYIGFRGVFQGEDGGLPSRALDPEPADTIEDISDP